MSRVLVPLQLDGAAPVLGARLHCLEGVTMGTTWQVRWVALPGTASGERVREAVQAELDTVVEQMSTWLRGSDVDRFNGAAAGTRHAVREPMADVLQAALWMADVSGGAFNPAAGALVNLWGFGPAPRYTDAGFAPPDHDAVRFAIAHLDWRALKWDAASRTIEQPGGVLLDFSAIAKGHAVDRVALRLARFGLVHALVEVGGELRGQGLRPDGQPWWVDLEWPPTAPGVAPMRPTRLALHGLSVATSGDYRRTYTHGDTAFAHTIDPRHGRPVSHGLASVSVVHAECLWADAWSTALTVLGCEQGLALAREHGVAALFVQREPDGRLSETLTPAMEKLAG